MSEWWTYRLSSFLMFSPKTYWRTVELFNQEFWPAHLLLLAAGGGLLWLARPDGVAATRAQWTVLAAIWLWVGWAFHSQHYSQINWAAKYFALAFSLQGLALLGAGMVLPPQRVTVSPAARSQAAGVRVASGWLLAVGGVLLYPLLGLLVERPLAQVECFGMMPEPTALASAGLILLGAPTVALRALLLVIPLLSLVIGAATMWLVC